MSDPAPDQVRVATAALRAEAERWTRQAGVLTDTSTRAAGLDMTGLEPGIFGIFASAYRLAHAQVTGRATEGARAMTAVAATLRQVADTYDREETATEHRFRGLY